MTPEMLRIWNIDMQRVVEPGIFELMVGPSSDHTKTVKLTVASLNGADGEAAIDGAGASGFENPAW